MVQIRSVSMIKDQSKPMDWNKMTSEWQGLGQATNQRQKYRRLAYKHQRDGKMRNDKHMSKVWSLKFKVTIRICPINTLDSISLTFPTLLFSVIYKASDIVGRHNPAFPQLILKAYVLR